MIIQNDVLSLWFKLSIQNLKSKKQVINTINLFPVADSDTGNNIIMTLEEAYEMFIKQSNELDLDDYLTLISHSVLLSARGNSGIILSEVVSSICESFSGRNELDIETLGGAFKLADSRARQSISHPVDGTILDITRSASNFFKDTNLDDIFSVTNEASQDLYISLFNTSQIIPVLKNAGVVDAGAYCLTIIYDSLFDVINNVNRGPVDIDMPSSLKLNTLTNKVVASEPFQYEVMFNCMYDDYLVDMKRELEGISSEIVITGGPDICKIHFHTYNLGKCVETVYNYCSPKGLQIHAISIYNVQ